MSSGDVVERANILKNDFYIEEIMSITYNGKVFLDVRGSEDDRYRIVFSNVWDYRVSKEGVCINRLEKIDGFKCLSGKIYEIINSDYLQSFEEISCGVYSFLNLRDFLIQDRIDSVFEVLCLSEPVVVDMEKQEKINEFVDKYRKVVNYYRGAELLLPNDARSIISECAKSGILVSDVRIVYKNEEAYIPLRKDFYFREDDYQAMMDYVNTCENTNCFIEFVFSEF